MIYVLIMILGIFIGFAVGFIFALYGQRELEKGYITKGIAKIFGDYYRIEKIPQEDKYENKIR